MSVQNQQHWHVVVEWPLEQSLTEDDRRSLFPRVLQALKGKHSALSFAGSPEGVTTATLAFGVEAVSQPAAIKAAFEVAKSTLGSAGLPETAELALVDCQQYQPSATSA